MFAFTTLHVVKISEFENFVSYTSPLAVWNTLMILWQVFVLSLMEGLPSKYICTRQILLFFYFSTQILKLFWFWNSWGFTRILVATILPYFLLIAVINVVTENPGDRDSSPLRRVSHCHSPGAVTCSLKVGHYFYKTDWKKYIHEHVRMYTHLLPALFFPFQTSKEPC